MMTCGVYALINIRSGKQYVGSATDIRRRTNNHFLWLRRGCHWNPRLSAAYAIHGREAFTYEVLEECPREQLFEREQYWIDTLKPNYNVRSIAESNRGLRVTPESNAKRSATLKRTLASPEARATKARVIREVWADSEQKARRIAALKAVWTPKKRSAWSERMKQVNTKVKQAGEVRWAKPGARQRASETLRRLHAEGRMVRHHSDETKRRISETKRRRKG